MLVELAITGGVCVRETYK